LVNTCDNVSELDVLIKKFTNDLSIVQKSASNFNDVLDYDQVTQHVEGIMKEIAQSLVKQPTLTFNLTNLNNLISQLNKNCQQTLDTQFFLRFPIREISQSCAPVKLDSIIVADPKHPKMIKDWINPKEDLEFHLLYRGSRDGFGADTFHAKCDSAQKTVTIIKDKANNRVFGGYADQRWNSVSKSHQRSTGTFLFSVDEREKYSLITPNTAIYCRSDYGPTFGSGFDLYVADNCDVNESSSKLINGFERKGKEYEILAKADKFLVEEIEVFAVVSKDFKEIKDFKGEERKKKVDGAMI